MVSLVLDNYVHVKLQGLFVKLDLNIFNLLFFGFVRGNVGKSAALVVSCLFFLLVMLIVTEIFTNVNWDDKWQKSTVKNKTLHFPLKQNREATIIKFPKELILGPEQVQAIRSGTKRTVIFGEAGSGKTTVLPSILFMNAGNYVAAGNLRKVYFILPSQKAELRDSLQQFINENCRKEWVQIEDLEKISNIQFCSENFYLIDEFYGCCKAVDFPGWAKIWISSTSVDSNHASDPNIFPSYDEINIYYFTRLYRSAVMISKACAKIRRLIDQCNPNAESFTRYNFKLPRFISFGPSSQVCVYFVKTSEMTSDSVPKVTIPKIWPAGHFGRIGASSFREFWVW